VVGIIFLNSQQVYILFDPEATHLFMSYQVVNKLHVLPSKLKKRLIVSTPLGETIDIDHTFKGIKITIRGYNMKVDLVPLKLYDFNLIMGMD